MELKTPWVLVGTSSTGHLKIAYRTAWNPSLAYYLLYTSLKMIFRKLLKILNQ